MATRPLPIVTAASSAETSRNGTAGTPPRLAPSQTSMAAATRRGFLSGAVALPSAMVGAVAACAVPTPAAASSVAADRAEWGRLCTAYREATAAELLAIDAHETRLSLWRDRGSEPKPQEPNTYKVDKSMSLNDIIAAGKKPEVLTAWAAYEAALAEWSARRDAEKAVFMADLEVVLDSATVKVNEAFVALKGYPVSTLALLADKAEILHEFFGGDGLEGEEATALIADIQRLAATGAEA